MGLVLGGTDGYGDKVRDGIGREDGEFGGYSHVLVRPASVRQESGVLEGSGAVQPDGGLDARLVPLPSPAPVPLQGHPPAPAAGEPSGALESPVARVAVDRAASTTNGTATRIPVDVWITFYTCPPYCATTASGASVHVGGAACGYGFELGQQFLLAGSRYTCNDRGGGPSLWVDIFFWDEAEGWAWLAQVGSYGTVILQ